jgi:hypothetical protein
MIFVFGSNMAGRHGKGAALFAKQNRGAIEGVGEGIQGQSYGIPTKDGLIIKYLSDPRSTLTLKEIEPYVKRFIKFAEEHPHLTFQLTPIGCGLAGYKPHQIAPMFKDAPPNVIKPVEFQ